MQHPESTNGYGSGSHAAAAAAAAAIPLPDHSEAAQGDSRGLNNGERLDAMDVCQDVAVDRAMHQDDMDDEDQEEGLTMAQRLGGMGMAQTYLEGHHTPPFTDDCDAAAAAASANGRVSASLSAIDETQLAQRLIDAKRASMSLSDGGVYIAWCPQRRRFSFNNGKDGITLFTPAEHTERGVSEAFREALRHREAVTSKRDKGVDPADFPPVDKALSAPPFDPIPAVRGINFGKNKVGLHVSWLSQCGSYGGFKARLPSGEERNIPVRQRSVAGCVTAFLEALEARNRLAADAGYTDAQIDITHVRDILPHVPEGLVPPALAEGGGGGAGRRPSKAAVEVDESLVFPASLDEELVLSRLNTYASHLVSLVKTRQTPSSQQGGSFFWNTSTAHFVVRPRSSLAVDLTTRAFSPQSDTLRGLLEALDKAIDFMTDQVDIRQIEQHVVAKVADAKKQGAAPMQTNELLRRDARSVAAELLMAKKATEYIADGAFQMGFEMNRCNFFVQEGPGAADKMRFFVESPITRETLEAAFANAVAHRDKIREQRPLPAPSRFSSHTSPLPPLDRTLSPIAQGDLANDLIDRCLTIIPLSMKTKRGQCIQWHTAEGRFKVGSSTATHAHTISPADSTTLGLITALHETLHCRNILQEEMRLPGRIDLTRMQTAIGLAVGDDALGSKAPHVASSVQQPKAATPQLKTPTNRRKRRASDITVRARVRVKRDESGGEAGGEGGPGGDEQERGRSSMPLGHGVSKSLRQKGRPRASYREREEHNLDDDMGGRDEQRAYFAQIGTIKAEALLQALLKSLPSSVHERLGITWRPGPPAGHYRVQLAGQPGGTFGPPTLSIKAIHSSLQHAINARNELARDLAMEGGPTIPQISGEALAEGISATEGLAVPAFIKKEEPSEGGDADMPPPFPSPPPLVRQGPPAKKRRAKHGVAREDASVDARRSARPSVPSPSRETSSSPLTRMAEQALTDRMRHPDESMEFGGLQITLGRGAFKVQIKSGPFKTFAIESADEQGVQDALQRAVQYRDTLRAAERRRNPKDVRLPELKQHLAGSHLSTVARRLHTILKRTTPLSKAPDRNKCSPGIVWTPDCYTLKHNQEASAKEPTFPLPTRTTEGLIAALRRAVQTRNGQMPESKRISMDAFDRVMSANIGKWDPDEEADESESGGTQEGMEGAAAATQDHQQLQQQQQHQRGSPSPTEARASNGNRSLVDMLANSLREQLYAASSPPKMSSGVPRIYWTRQNRRYSIQRSSAIGNAKPRYVGSVVPQTLTREGLLEALRECVEIVNREAPEAGLDFNAMLANQGGEGEDGHGGGGMAGGASSAHREASPDQAMPDLGCEVQYGGLVMPVEVPVVVKIEQE